MELMWVALGCGWVVSEYEWVVSVYMYRWVVAALACMSVAVVWERVCLLG